MQWTISRRIAVAFTLGFGLVLVIAALGDRALARTSRSFENALESERELLAGALRAESDMRRANLQHLRMLMTRDPFFEELRDSLVAVTQERIERLRDREHPDELRRLWSEALALIDEWQAALQASTAALRVQDQEEALRLEEVLAQPVRDELDRVLALALEELEAWSDETVAAALEDARRSRAGLWLGTVLVLLVGGLLAWRVARSMNEPLRETSHVLATSATEILASTSQQASGANQSMAAVTETAATVDEVAQTADQAAERARTVASTAQRADEIGRQGREAVERSMNIMAEVKEQVDAIGESMVALAEQAESIGEIIAAVNDLADQTNLLALNAGIEAARAGEHGRGFAVVASEVKALAEGSKAATTRVRQILGEIQKATSRAVLSTEQGTKKVAGGMRQVTEAGETIRALVAGVSEAAQAAAQIAASAGQQSMGMSQIREAIANIQQAAQQNLAATRQSEAAARELHRAGQGLVELIGRDGRAGSSGE